MPIIPHVYKLFQKLLNLLSGKGCITYLLPAGYHLEHFGGCQISFEERGVHKALEAYGNIWSHNILPFKDHIACLFIYPSMSAKSVEKCAFSLISMVCHGIWIVGMVGDQHLLFHGRG